MNKYLTLGICLLLFANVLSSLSTSAADSVMDYATFEGVNATTMQEDVEHFYDVDPRGNIISVNGFTFDCLKEEPIIQDGLRAIEPKSGEIGLYIIHFSCSINQEIDDAIEALSIKITGSVPFHAYQVRMTPEQALEAQNLSFVDWVGFYHPAYKISPNLEPDQLELEVQLTCPEISDEAIQEVRSKFDVIEWEGYATASAVSKIGYLFKGILSSSESINEIARNPYVHYIYPIPVGHLMDEAAIQIVGGGLWVDDNDANHNTPYRTSPGSFGSRFNQITGCSGQGMIVGIADSGLGDGTIGDAGHPDFGNRIIGGMSYAGGGWNDVTGHGTHCAGLIAANGFSGTGITYNGYGPYYAGMGLAYDANFYIQKFVASNPPGDVGIILRDAEANGVKIHSNSWGDNEGGDYNVWDQAYDSRTRDADQNVFMNQQILAIVAAGNGGPNWNTIGSPGNAKNVITVGGTENYMPDSLSFGNTNPKNTVNPDAIDTHSSRGWTSDGRIKPDIVAPGENILSTRSPSAPLDNLYGTYTADNRYEWCSGTSQATPIVAGGATVVYSWYQNKGHGMNPSPAMIKALLINSAQALGDIPNRDEGWGRMCLTPFADHPNLFYVIDQDNILSGKLTTGQYHEFELSYMDNSQPFKVTLVWTDPPAELGTGPALMNNLNLQVTSPGGSVYRGNVFSAGWSVTGGTHDYLNNVECVYIPPNILTPGKYTIRVSGYDVQYDCDYNGVKDQDYALVVYNGLEDNTPPISSVTRAGAYWRNTSPFTITATASNGLSGVKDVSLWYRYSGNNLSWGDWSQFGTVDATAPYEWGFAPAGWGYYQFYTIATDNAGNAEAVPTSPEYDAWYAYDLGPPTPFDLVTPPSPANGATTTNHRPTFDWATSTDSLSGIHHYQLLVDDNSNFQSPLIDAQVDSSKTEYLSTNYPAGVYLSDVKYYWKVKAFDYAGNVRDSTSTWYFTVYTEPVPQQGNVGGIVWQPGCAVTIPGATITHVGAAPTANPGTGDSLSSGGEGSAICTTTTISASDGSWWMAGISAGPATFTASKSGYYSQTESTNIPSSGRATLNFYLTPISSSSDGGGGGGGGGGVGGCLLPGTKISTPSGTINVEDICEGDMVLSYDEWTGLMEPRMVYQTVAHANYGGYIAINNRLNLTANHLVYTTTRGLVAAEFLAVGDDLIAIGGSEIIADIQRVPLLVTVYNIDVEDNHNYYAEGILVHNVFTLKEGCPFLYVWNGAEFVEENNILPQATKPDRTQLDVADYYMFQNEMEPLNGSYSVQIYEPALEKTKLDNVQLAIIDYDDPDIFPIISPDGTLLTIGDQLAVESCIDSSGSEVCELVDEKDDGYRMQVGHNETLTAYFPEVAGFTDLKLVIAHKAIIDLLPYDVPLDPRFYKCSIHVQTMDSLGEWHDFSSIPARMNWALDCIDISPLKDSIMNGEPIRLLITGTHIIDYIGIDISDNVNLDVEYILPSDVCYNNTIGPLNINDLLVRDDQRYAVINPKECIEILFPYVDQVKPYRAIAFIPYGHYNTLTEIDIEQPVTIKADIETGADGFASIFLYEMNNQNEATELIGMSANVSSWSPDQMILNFVQNPREQYTLVGKFEGCTAETEIAIEITSFGGTKTCYMKYCPEMGSIAEIKIPLDDILWNVTGVKFNEYTNHYSVLKDTMLQIDLNEWYHYETEIWSNFTWNFGDGSWTGDVRPTHVYNQLGLYLLNLTVDNSGPGMMFYSDTWVDVVSSLPIPAIDIYQEVSLALTISGRKDNKVTIQIYEDGELIQSQEVMRTPGPPNTITFRMNKYLDREYSIELVYDAAHSGANPTWLTFSSGCKYMTFFKDFKTQNGFHQTETVPGCYLNSIVKDNPSFWFDASSSYDIDGQIVSYEWDFGDGTAGSGETLAHVYQAPGTYTVTLTVTDDDGLAATISRPVQVGGFSHRPPRFPRH